jgi:hypothetical protein
MAAEFAAILVAPIVCALILDYYGYRPYYRHHSYGYCRPYNRYRYWFSRPFYPPGTGG